VYRGYEEKTELMKKNWKDIPIPELMNKFCERDSRGMPVPFVVLKDEAGKHHFKINDTAKTLQCIAGGLCAICGQKMRQDDRWMVGGIASAFDKNGIYIDHPVHKECAQYALQVCPYLASRNYDTTKTDLEKLAKKVVGSTILVNPTVDPDRLPLFVLLRPLQIGYFTSKQDSTDIRVKPFGPYHEVEFWDDGEQITDIEVVKMKLIGTKWEKYLNAIYEQCRIPAPQV
jgi:hypothetical protein